MNKYSSFLSVFLFALLLQGCSSEEGQNQVETNVEVSVVQSTLAYYPLTALPEGLVWETNNDDPVFSSPNAKKGGTYMDSVQGFPLSLRSYGPDARGIFANYLHSYQMLLINIHPNTGNPIPELATHWAFDNDGVTVYYKLDPKATWSDGKPVTADDYLFTRDFM